MDKQRGQKPLPELTHVKGLQLKGAFNLLDAEQRRKLDDALEEDAKTRQLAEANSATLRLG